MGFEGIAKGNHIILDQPLPMPDGTRLRVEVSPLDLPRKGSPAALLRLAGSLSEEEAQHILEVAGQCRQVDERLWNGRQ